MKDKPLYKIVRDERSPVSDEVVEFVERVVNGAEFEKRGEAAFREEWERFRVRHEQRQVEKLYFGR